MQEGRPRYIFIHSNITILIFSLQMAEKRLHVPMVDRTPEEAPPVVVAVVGPPGVFFSARYYSDPNLGGQDDVNKKSGPKIQ